MMNEEQEIQVSERSRLAAFLSGMYRVGGTLTRSNLLAAGLPSESPLPDSVFRVVRLVNTACSEGVRQTFTLRTCPIITERITNTISEMSEPEVPRGARPFIPQEARELAEQYGETPLTDYHRRAATLRAYADQAERIEMLEREIASLNETGTQCGSRYAAVARASQQNHELAQQHRHEAERLGKENAQLRAECLAIREQMSERCSGYEREIAARDEDVIAARRDRDAMRELLESANRTTAMQLRSSERATADLFDILRALGLFAGARPISAHEVVQTEVLPAIEMLKKKNTELRIERDAYKAAVKG